MGVMANTRDDVLPRATTYDEEPPQEPPALPSARSNASAVSRRSTDRLAQKLRQRILAAAGPPENPDLLEFFLRHCGRDRRNMDEAEFEEMCRGSLGLTDAD